MNRTSLLIVGAYSSPLSLLRMFIGCVMALTMVANGPRWAYAQAVVPGQTKAIEAPRAVMILDRSGSMASGNPTRLDVTKVAAKLFVASLPETFEIVIVDFASTARSEAFTLKSDAERRRAFDHIDGLRAEGGTDYCAALTAAGTVAGAPIVFLSDGAPGNPPEAILKIVREGRYGALHTIGIDVGQQPAAKKILADMAAEGRGSFVEVIDSEALMRAFLGIAAHVGHYRSLDPKQKELALTGVTGNLIAIGFDSMPSFESNGQALAALRTHTARLPGEEVSFVLTRFEHPAPVTVRAAQPRTAQGRLFVIYRDDLARATTELQGVSPNGAVPMGGTLQAVTTFTDSQGKPLDPRKSPNLAAEVRVADEQGKLLSTTPAKLHPSQPALVASVPLPNSGKNITVTTSTSDSGFVASAPRTVTLTKPFSLTATPSSIAAQVKSGPFVTVLKLRPAEPVTGAITYTAVLDAAPAGVRLVKVDPHTEGLLLHWDASEIGQRRGALTVTATGGVPFIALSVPVEFTIASRWAGLDRKAEHEERLGTAIANSGTVALGKLVIAAKDDEATDYAVAVTDFASGSHAIPLSAGAPTIRPKRSQPVELTLSGMIGNVPAGDYTATVTLKNEAGSWKTTVRLTVEDALAADPVAFGKLEPNGVRAVTVTVRNRSREGISKLALVPPKFTVAGGEIDAAMPATLDLIPAGKSATFTLRLAAGASVSSRGEIEAALGLKRDGGGTVTVPVKVTLVEPGQGNGAAIAVAPERLTLGGTPGDVVSAEFRVKLSGGTGSSKVTGTAGNFTLAGKSVEVDVTFQLPDQELTLATPVQLGVRLIAPKAPGVYSGTVTVQAGDAGKLAVPVTLTVR